MVEATATIDVEASPEQAYAVLWDVAQYPDFLSDVLDASVDDTGSQTVATMEVRIFRTRRFRVALTGDRPTRITWTLVEGEHLRAIDGAWQLEGLGPQLTRLHYRVMIDASVPMPDAIVRRFVDFGLPTVLRQVKARVEALAALQLV